MVMVKLPSSNSPTIQVPPTHLAGSRLLFCGESAGKEEVRLRKGFSGSSGQMLRRITKSVGIDFNQCSLTNVIKELPIGGSVDSYYLDKKKNSREQPGERIQWWWKLLEAEVSQYNNYHLVVALGDEALYALTGLRGITKWRGSILSCKFKPSLKVIPDVHPSYIMRDNWADYYIAIRNAKKWKEEVKLPQRLLKEPPDVFIIKPRLDQALEWIEFIGKPPFAPWYLDVETVGDSLRCFGLSSDARPKRAICIPLHTSTGPYWSVRDEATIWSRLSLAAGRNPLFRNQNCVYDLDYILDMGVEPSQIDFDPMVGMNVAYPEFPKGLDFTTSLFTYYEYYKDEGKTWKKKEPDEKVWTYNCKDMVATPKVSNGCVKDLKEKKLYDCYNQRSGRMLGIALEMQRNRLLLDRDWYQRFSELLEGEREETHRKLVALVGEDINVKSTPDVGRLLFDKLKLPTKFKRGSGGKITTDENAIKELRASYPDVPELNLILKERHLRTKLSNYINVKFDIDADGDRYLPYMGVVGGAKTGRWAFSKSPKWRGSSPQTIPKVMRLMYQPPLGSVFWQRDLSQAEARIVAWLAECRFLLDVFNSPIKIHKVVGGRIFKKPPNEIISDSMEYDISKRVVHAYNYMMQAKKLAVTANLPLPFAEWTLEEYGKQVPEIKEWHKKIKQTAITTGRLVTPMGRVRECFSAASAVTHTGQLPDEILRDLVSYIPQSTVPDLTNECMWKLWTAFPSVKWHQQGHDSFLASGPHELTREFYEGAERFADIHFIINGRDCHIPGEFQWGYRWGALLKYIPGEDTTFGAWERRANTEGYFELEGKNGIKEKLYSLLT